MYFYLTYSTFISCIHINMLFCVSIPAHRYRCVHDLQEYFSSIIQCYFIYNGRMLIIRTSIIYPPSNTVSTFNAQVFKNSSYHSMYLVSYYFQGYKPYSIVAYAIYMWLSYLNRRDCCIRISLLMCKPSLY